MTKKILYIRIEYEDGSYSEIHSCDLKRIAELKDTVDLLEKARCVYDNLVRVFGKIDV